MKKDGLALVLSGGAAKGVAHLGVLQALEEAGIRPAVISGVSAGAIVGALYCNGYSPKQIMEIIKENSVIRNLRLTRGTGLLKLDKAEKIFRKYLKIDKFENLMIPLFISAVDVENTKLLEFSKGDIIPPLLGSSSLPPIFRPVNYQGKKLADGGLINNLPVFPVIDYKKILGVNANYIKTSPESFAEYAEWVINIVVNTNIRDSIPHCNVFLEPPGMKDFSTRDIGKADEMFKVGYDYTIEKMDLVLEMMK